MPSYFKPSIFKIKSKMWTKEEGKQHLSRVRKPVSQAWAEKDRKDQ